MGSLLSRMKNKNTNVQIKDYNKVIVPKGYKIMKIATHNINLRNTINIQTKISNITSFLLSEFKNKDIDIICLQGIHDYSSASQLIQHLKIKLNSMEETFYLAPSELEDIQAKAASVPLDCQPKEICPAGPPPPSIGATILASTTFAPFGSFIRRIVSAAPSSAAKVI